MGGRISRGRRRAELYERLLTADPPVCGGGDPVAVLNSCERRRRGVDCLCRIDANELSEDAETLGCAAIGEAVLVDLEPGEVEALLADVELCLASGRPTLEVARDAYDRVSRVRGRLEVLVEHEVGLTDRYSDDAAP